MQQEVALKILKTGRNVFLTGAAGAGKTYVLNQYIRWLREHRIGVGITASTGIAATHIGGQTIHSFSGIGIRDYLDEWTLDALTQKQKLSRRFENIQVLILDEISMLGAHTLEMVDQVAQALKRNSEPFGGLQVVFTGDFFQLPPISRGGSYSQFAYISPAWERADIRTCYLSEQHRQKDATLAGVLNEMRARDVSKRSRTALDDRMKAEPTNDTRTRLFSHNKDVDVRNDDELAKIDGSAHTYTMTSRGQKKLVESLKSGILAPESLVLKKGAAVMFVKNDQIGRFANGTLGTIEDLGSETVVVKTLNGESITVEPLEWSVEEDGKVLASVSQLPLRLAWAITIHKSQGMSLDAAEMDLSKTFTPGQGYVALSRVRTLEGLFLRGLNSMALTVDERVAHKDQEFLEDSDKWAHVVSRFSDEKLSQLTRDFIDACGGVHEAQPVEAIAVAPKKSTLEITADLLNQGQTLEEVAKERKLTKGTIIGHVEKLKQQGITFDLKKDRPTAGTLKEIRLAFKKGESDKLTPVHKALKGKYTFDELRLARLFI